MSDWVKNAPDVEAIHKALGGRENIRELGGGIGNGLVGVTVHDVSKVDVGAIKAAGTKVERFGPTDSFVLTVGAPYEDFVLDFLRRS
ncbi:hypothetical protein PEM37_39275 [Streptomyces sp. AD681]|uniref:hypothetical protein n=1 Tax=Streptomyces sp. AD681 TaxID=3019069 RepID=UPI0022F14CF6|nr:hypothetical protein [Streptomyces sp. AD681]MDA5147544.1 hypothetical protein [Streptomyces sp. AD681]